ncbi:hypothetical protein [Kitasatospora sp. NPDC057738]|uniref:hypothetical protein n=1 Tax=Kitasatospora sp. NPDC057738 TaxID=3346233 RepID=UPI0036B8A865
MEVSLGTVGERPFLEEEVDPYRLVGAMIVGLLQRKAAVEDRSSLDVGLTALLGGLLLKVAAYTGALACEPPKREALVAALAARGAAIRGNTGTVNEFSRTWLGLSDPDRWHAAVEAALLGDWVEELGRGWSEDPEIITLLRRCSREEHRNFLPLWERKAQGRRLMLLGQHIGADLTVADLLVDRRAPEAEALSAELADSRLLAVLRGLAPDEVATTRAWAAGEETWALAALAVGLPAEFGERVRRKLKRLGTRHTERALAAGTVTR